MPETLPPRNFVSLRAGLDPSLERLGIAPKAFKIKKKVQDSARPKKYG